MMSHHTLLCVFITLLICGGTMARAPINIVGSSILSQASPPSVISPRVGYLDSPLGVDVAKPRFSWYISHPDRGQGQSAYQIQVSTTSNFAAGSIVWDSGKVASHKLHATYAGTPLKSDTSYYWRVTAWDLNNAFSSWTSSTFGTGLLTPSEWVGRWIGGNGNILRRAVALPNSPSRARAFISGIGYYELSINGKKVGDAKLDPGWTTYNKRVLYNVYDVTAYLNSGNNIIGVSLGHGWYSSTETREPNGPRSLIFQLSVDGKIVAQSDGAWNISQGPITYDSIYNGETYDARLEQAGWDTPSFIVTSKWQAAQPVNGPGGALSYQMIPPVRVTRDIKAIGITKPANNKYVIDFGQNFSGWTKLSITGPAGTNVTLRYAETLQNTGNGMIYTDNLRNAKATDIYLLKGDKNGETFEPHFTYHGFRYVEFSAVPPIVPALDTLLGRHANTDVSRSGHIEFSASSDILNQIQHNVVWGQESNIMSVPTDCDQRDERKGWMGDAQLSAEEALHNFYVPAVYTHFLNLIQDEQGPDGSLTDTVPWTFGSRPADPAWGSAYPSLVYWMWQHYDDDDLVRQHYSSVKAYIDYLRAQVAKTGLGKMFYNYGDWVPPPPAARASEHLTSAFSYIANIFQFVQLAGVVGNTADYNSYLALIPGASQDFNTAFLNTKTALYDNGVQTAMALPLWLGIVPSAHINNVTMNLLNDIAGPAHRTHLTTGIIGAKYLMELLNWIGRDDIALQLAENVDYPSWGYMAVNPLEPATTVWELWDAPNEGPGMNSRSHIMFGSVSDWFYKSLAGVKQGNSSHFDTITIQPSLVGDLLGVSASFETGQGIITSEYSRFGGDTICGSGAEGQPINLDCGGIGSEGVITDIKFASFGLPHGQCGRFAAHDTCDAIGVREFVHSNCVGKRSCSMMATHTHLGVQKACSDFSRMYVEAVCSKPAAATGYNMKVTIPTGATADISFSRLGLSNPNISESGNSFWVNGVFQANNVVGVRSAVLVGNNVHATVGSGSYNFLVSGNPGTLICGVEIDGTTLKLQCPTGQMINYIPFAEYGLPSGQCGSFRPGNCQAGSGLTVVRNACLGKQSCSVQVSPNNFGDPCFGTPKNLAVEAYCT